MQQELGNTGLNCMFKNSKGTISVFKIERRDRNNNIRKNKYLLANILLNSKPYTV